MTRTCRQLTQQLQFQGKLAISGVLKLEYNVRLYMNKLLHVQLLALVFPDGGRTSGMDLELF